VTFLTPLHIANLPSANLSAVPFFSQKMHYLDNSSGLMVSYGQSRTISHNEKSWITLWVTISTDTWDCWAVGVVSTECLPAKICRVSEQQ